MEQNFYKKLREWYTLHTFHHSQFSNIDKLIDLKRKKKKIISVAIPTLNEEETIGDIVSCIKKEFMEKKALVDELVVIDSDSKDKTRQIAEKNGAKVYLASNYLKKYGKFKGKGNNLWLSLYLLKGDIIIWIDGDIKNIHPKFVYGLIGVLLENDHIQFVKGFYERPFLLDGKLIKTGGGRVTEILVKPLLATYFPELCVIQQPLAGECGVRRSTLKKLRFPVGFGVEISLLVDIYIKFGLDTIAQVDLDERIHRTPPVERHPKMSFEVLGTFLRKMEEIGLAKFVERLPSEFISARGKRELNLENCKFNFVERPPIITIPEYVKQQEINLKSREVNRNK